MKFDAFNQLHGEYRQTGSSPNTHAYSANSVGISPSFRTKVVQSETAEYLILFKGLGHRPQGKKN